MKFVVALAIGEVISVTSVLLGQTLPDPYGPLLTYGPLGLFSVLLLTSRIVSRAELDRANARADRAEAQRDELASRMVSDIIPLVTEVQRTMVPTLQELTKAVERIIDSRRLG